MIEMNKPLKRRYIYEETYNKVMEWAKEVHIKSPNRKDNFPFFLEQYLKR